MGGGRWGFARACWRCSASGRGSCHYAGATNSASSGDRNAVLSATTLVARGGLGLRFQVSKSFELFPEVSLMKYLAESKATILVFGLGFNFGKLPKYTEGPDDDDEENKPKPATPAPAKPAPTDQPATPAPAQ